MVPHSCRPRQGPPPHTPARPPSPPTLPQVTPITLFCILIFLITFEVLANLASELLRLADRPIYGAWWGSTSFEVFAREWNKPVSDFLRRHVYEPAGATPCALAATFLFSIVLHEVFLWGAMGGRWRAPWLALFSLLQLPLRPLLRAMPKTALGNVIFWAGLSGGLGVISLLYAMDYQRAA